MINVSITLHNHIEFSYKSFFKMTKYVEPTLVYNTRKTKPGS